MSHPTKVVSRTYRSPETCKGRREKGITMKTLFALGLVLFAFGCGGQTPVAETQEELSARRCHKNDATYRYVGNSKSECSRIRFFCAEGVYFADNCGCGCLVEETCPIISCAAPPEGCHYEGMVSSPCDQQTCGTLVCDGSTL